jgi:Trypsin-like peptidase domain
MTRAFSLVILIALMVGTLIFANPTPEGVSTQTVSPTSTSQSALATTTAVATSASSTVASTTKPTTKKKITTPPPPTISTESAQEVVAAKASQTSQAEPNDPNAVNRNNNPYPFPPQPFEVINENARNALVNIVCGPQSGTMQPISASGVIIDPRGVVLTNAHVAQYVLLSQSPKIDLVCKVRSGSPATFKWKVTTLYIPPAWVNAHVKDINNPKATGTGQHDHALLLLTETLEGDPIGPLPFLVPDSRETIAFEGDQVLVASYPVEFIGSATQSAFYAVTSLTQIRKLLTFVQQTVDLLSLGGIIGAQGGSSGGAVVNQWGRLVGVVVTTSAGATTGERDLHALTLSYISRDLAAQSKVNLEGILSTDVRAAAESFGEILAPQLISKYLEVLGI